MLAKSILMAATASLCLAQQLAFEPVPQAPEPTPEQRQKAAQLANQIQKKSKNNLRASLETARVEVKDVTTEGGRCFTMRIIKPSTVPYIRTFKAPDVDPKMTLEVPGPACDENGREKR
jgi:hypothetical protein